MRRCKGCNKLINIFRKEKKEDELWENLCTGCNIKRIREDLKSSGWTDEK